MFLGSHPEPGCMLSLVCVNQHPNCRIPGYSYGKEDGLFSEVSPRKTISFLWSQNQAFASAPLETSREQRPLGRCSLGPAGPWLCGL